MYFFVIGTIISIPIPKLLLENNSIFSAKPHPFLIRVGPFLICTGLIWILTGKYQICSGPYSLKAGKFPVKTGLFSSMVVTFSFLPALAFAKAGKFGVGVDFEGRKCKRKNAKC
jgi:hypothetical protein